MSAIFQEIQAAESQAKEAVLIAKKNMQEVKSASLQKAKGILDDFVKDADASFESKVTILEKELQERKEKELEVIKKESESYTSKTDEYVKKGVSFLFPFLVSQS